MNVYDSSDMREAFNDGYHKGKQEAAHKIKELEETVSNAKMHLEQTVGKHMLRYSAVYNILNKH